LYLVAQLQQHKKITQLLNRIITLLELVNKWEKQCQH
jgi:hypothetical protein